MASARLHHVLLLMVVAAVAFCYLTMSSYNIERSWSKKNDVERKMVHSSKPEPKPKLKPKPKPKMEVEVPRCNILEGRWVRDNFTPAYNASSCPFVSPKFNCDKNGRLDTEYLKYRWQPDGCSLPRFDGSEFLKRFKGKKIMLVGDSLVVTQWESLVCMIHSALPHVTFRGSLTKTGVRVFNLPEYDITIMMQWKAFLVEIEKHRKGRALKLDRIMGDEWKGFDVLVFYSYGWWFLKPPSQPWDYIELGGKTYKDMDRNSAYKTALESWAQWIEKNVDHSRTKVFFQGFSAVHYRGAEWGKPKQSGCSSITKPLSGNGSGLPVNPAAAIVRGVIAKMKDPAYFLDISRLSLLRPDGHVGIYSSPAHGRQDCTHWCLPGVPDTWNLLLYRLLLNQMG